MQLTLSEIVARTLGELGEDSELFGTEKDAEQAPESDGAPQDGLDEQFLDNALKLAADCEALAKQGDFMQNLPPTNAGRAQKGWARQGHAPAAGTKVPPLRGTQVETDEDDHPKPNWNPDRLLKHASAQEIILSLAGRGVDVAPYLTDEMEKDAGFREQLAKAMARATKAVGGGGKAMAGKVKATSKATAGKVKATSKATAGKVKATMGKGQAVGQDWMGRARQGAEGMRAHVKAHPYAYGAGAAGLAAGGAGGMMMARKSKQAAHASAVVGGRGRAAAVRARLALQELQTRLSGSRMRKVRRPRVRKPGLAEERYKLERRQTYGARAGLGAVGLAGGAGGMAVGKRRKTAATVRVKVPLGKTVRFKVPAGPTPGLAGVRERLADAAARAAEMGREGVEYAGLTGRSAARRARGPARRAKGRVKAHPYAYGAGAAGALAGGAGGVMYGRKRRKTAGVRGRLAKTMARMTAAKGRAKTTARGAARSLNRSIATHPFIYGAGLGGVSALGGTTARVIHERRKRRKTASSWSEGATSISGAKFKRNPEEEPGFIQPPPVPEWGLLRSTRQAVGFTPRDAARGTRRAALGAYFDRATPYSDPRSGELLDAASSVEKSARILSALRGRT